MYNYNQTEKTMKNYAWQAIIATTVLPEQLANMGLYGAGPRYTKASYMLQQTKLGLAKEMLSCLLSSAKTA